MNRSKAFPLNSPITNIPLRFTVIVSELCKCVKCNMKEVISQFTETKAWGSDEEMRNVRFSYQSQQKTEKDALPLYCTHRNTTVINTRGKVSLMDNKPP